MSILFTNRTVIATAVSATLLVGCGGSEGDTTSNSKTTFEVQAIDGYLNQADIKVDTNDDGACDTKVATTGSEGKALVDSQYLGKAICVEAIADTTVDETRGIVISSFGLKAPAGSAVINPMTDLVVDQMETLAIDVESAKDAVQTMIANQLELDVSELSEDQIFGDYIQDSSTNVLSKKLEIIGETLVDNHDLSAEQKLKVAELAAAKVADIADDELEDTSVTIERAIDGSIKEDAAKLNSRPTVEPSALTYDETFYIGDTGPVVYLNDYFTDADSDALTYTVNSLTSGLNPTIAEDSLTLDTGVAGIHTLHVFAFDGKTYSYPLVIKYEVFTPNTAPSFNEELIKSVQATLATWSLKQGDSFNGSVGISGLIIDKEQDAKTNVTISDSGLSAKIENEALFVNGTPSKFGQVNLTISVEDDEYPVTTQIFALTIEEGEEVFAGTFHIVRQSMENTGLLEVEVVDGTETENFSRADTAHASGSAHGTVEFNEDGTCTIRDEETFSEFDWPQSGDAPALPTLTGPKSDLVNCTFAFNAEENSLTVVGGPTFHISSDRNQLFSGDGYEEDSHTGTNKLLLVRQATKAPEVDGDYHVFQQFIEAINQDIEGSNPVMASIVEFGTMAFDVDAKTCDLKWIKNAVSEHTWDDGGHYTGIHLFESPSTDQESCSFALESDGRVNLMIDDYDDTSTFYSDPKGTVLIGTGAYQDTYEESQISGTYKIALLKKASGLVESDVHGEYKLNQHYIENDRLWHDLYSNPSSHFEQANVTLDANGACTYQFTSALSSYLDVNDGVYERVLDTEGAASIVNCNYTFNADEQSITIDKELTMYIGVEANVMMNVRGYKDDGLTGTVFETLVRQ
ncbi:hypothetical protein ACNUDM_20720 [Vibrio chaetopteri]|uniref:hypothetical protein n=1 Tax=Vibrio chaetopteri TaxID=3016528 RepID=UPI003AB55DF2